MGRICRYVVCVYVAAVGAAIFIPDALAQQSALQPHSMYEPPAAKAAASLAASSASVAADLLTTGEKTDWQETGVYAEAVALMRKFEQMSPQVKIDRKSVV